MAIVCLWLLRGGQDGFYSKERSELEVHKQMHDKRLQEGCRLSDGCACPNKVDLLLLSASCHTGIEWWVTRVMLQRCSLLTGFWRQTPWLFDIAS